MTQPTQTIFEQVLLEAARPVDAGLALLSWQLSDGAERLVQVYLNGQLHDAALDAQQRQLWMQLDRSIDNCVELLAVSPADRWCDFSSRLSAIDPPIESRATVAIVRDPSLPIDAQVELQVDAMVQRRSALWSALDTRGGFGSAMGLAQFGWDELTSPGLGAAEFGVGPFGSEGRAWRYETDRLGPGSHTLSLSVRDAAGRILGELAQPASVQLETLPRPAVAFTFENTPNGLILRWAASSTS